MTQQQQKLPLAQGISSAGLPLAQTPANTRTKASVKRNQSVQTPTPIRTSDQGAVDATACHQHNQQYHHHYHYHGESSGDARDGSFAVDQRQGNAMPCSNQELAAVRDRDRDLAPLSAPPLSQPDYPFNQNEDPAWRLVQQRMSEAPQVVATLGARDANVPPSDRRYPVNESLPPLPTRKATITPSPCPRPAVAPTTQQTNRSIASIPPPTPSLPTGYQLPAAFTARYELGDCLGSGGFGFVCAAYVRMFDQDPAVPPRLGREVAVKFVLKEKVPASAWARDETLGIVPNEIYLLKHLSHPNIIGYLDAFEDKLYFLLVTELHGGSWSQLLRNSQAPGVTPTPTATGTALPRRASSDLFECIELLRFFTEAQARHVFRQLASAVAHLDSFGIVHRDIKDENILIDDNFNVKIIDFGSASFLDQETDRLFLGTLQYAAPEILDGRKHQGPECEIWSLACCLYIMLVGEAPFESLRDIRLSPPLAPRDPNVAISPRCSHLLGWMFEKDPSRRPTIAQVMNHPWLLSSE
ncbi:kinase-like domain-containing protein [Zopfochytrium polystomum]|nr:kinase-like domain-containing protein [Zopfochytrium polystomum]